MRADLNWVTADLAVGGDLDPDDAIALAQVNDILDAGITHVVDLRIEDDDTEIWKAAEIAYLSVGTADADGHVVPAQVFDKGVRFARLAVRDGGRVLTHCHMGINRGPSMGFAILLDRGHSPIEAFDMIRAARPQAFVAYAQDALAAHAARQRCKGERPLDWEAEAKALERHIQAVLTPSKVGHIRHIMRQNRMRDLGHSV
ncbi:dual specificity protein phosphatase family protein [Paeniglutamicibacter sp. NPDC091659]|uniref:protein-tyrosine phosphatase family protein n=1 Tax=Paeniglutamicibacter sp. NPDC091659 TaxID=3364389 RepID=UPI0037FA49C8